MNIETQRRNITRVNGNKITRRAKGGQAQTNKVKKLPKNKRKKKYTHIKKPAPLLDRWGFTYK